MSWQDYVDNQLIASQCVSKACIAGHDGGVWAKSDGFEVSFATSNLEKKKKRRENSIVSSLLRPLFRKYILANLWKCLKFLRWAQTRTPAKNQSEREPSMWFVTTFFVRRLGVSDLAITVQLGTEFRDIMRPYRSSLHHHECRGRTIHTASIV